MLVPDAPLMSKLTVVRVARQADADLLVGWHADPDVARYWGGRTFTRGQMLARLTRDDVAPYIIQEAGEPVGYLQAWSDADQPDSCGLDMFLIPSARRRGLGPDAAQTIAHWLLAAGRVRRLTVDPELSNEHAIKGWEKAGFRAVGKRRADQKHSAPWLLMAMDRA